MRIRTREEIAQMARLTPADGGDAPAPNWVVRRRRLARLASLLDARQEPVQLFLAMEWVPKKERPALRQDGSPLTIAYEDPHFRREGLAGDSVGDGMAFFHLSMSQVHALFCECMYAHSPEKETSRLVAARVRSLAAKRTLAELWDKLKVMVEQWRRPNKHGQQATT